MTTTVAGEMRPVRQRLLDAGELLFAAHGWNGVSIRDSSTDVIINLTTGPGQRSATGA